MTVAAATDLMRPMMQHGLRKSLGPMASMLRNMDAVKIATKDLREMSVGLGTFFQREPKLLPT